MARLTSHTLNGVDGTHAAGVQFTFYRIEADDSRTELFRASSDDGGRLAQEIEVGEIVPGAAFELVLETAAYFEGVMAGGTPAGFVRQTVVRIVMPDPDGNYHIPFILSPNSHSVWYSA